MSILQNFFHTDRKCRRKFLVNMAWKGLRGFRQFKKRSRIGKLFPAFQFISVTNDCNLKCQGCWVHANGSKQYMPAEQINAIIEAGKQQGSYFYGILGGEPLMYRNLDDIFMNHPDCYFQVFTNGTLFNHSTAEAFRQAGNVSPLFSFEGDELVADIRRGGRHIYDRTLNAISTATAHGLITGVAVSVCKSNIDMALSDEFINQLHLTGVLYLWYYIYRPAGSNPCYELALDADEILRLRKFLVEGRGKYPIVLIDSYWRANGEPFCPAADGLSHHINPQGHIEPCPVVQFACENVTEGALNEVYERSTFLKGFKNEIQQKTRGCILMEDPKWLKDMTERYGAQNTSNRPGYPADLANAPRIVSHGSCQVIPERHLLYRLAKKTAFLGMGAYG